MSKNRKMKFIVEESTQKPTRIKVKDMPIGSIGKHIDGLYVVRTNENGPAFLRIWTRSFPPGLALGQEGIEEEWDVELLPSGSKLILESNYE